MEFEDNTYVGKYADLQITPLTTLNDEVVASVTHLRKEHGKGEPFGYNIEIPFPELRALVDAADANGQPHADLGRRVWAVRIAAESLGQGHPGIRELAEWLSGA